MELIVSVGRREETVAIEEDGQDCYLVRLGDRSYRVNSVATGPGLRSLLVKKVSPGQEDPAEKDSQRQWEISVRPLAEDSYEVSAAGPRASVRVTVEDPLTHQAREALGESGKSGPHRVEALMPGRVIALLVEEGAPVEEGQGVLVLEAMKMENEISAESGGIVRKLLVEEGQAVDSGDPLFEIE